MSLAIAFAIVLPAAATYSTLRLLGVARLLALALAPGLALGITSTIYFVLLATTTAGAPVLFDSIVWLTMFGGLMLVWSRRDRRAPSQELVNTGARGNESTPVLAIAAIGCVGLVALAVTAIWLRLQLMPHGETDGVAIWNLRARSLSRGTPDWTAILSPAIGWSHPSYPLMLPLTIARLWSYAGGESTAVPQLVALVFFGSSVATVGVSVAHLCGATAGLLSAMTVVAARTYVFQVSCQCADVPIGFFILVATIFVVLAQESPPLLLVAGTAAGLAAWTKNEGQLLFVLIGGLVLIGFRNRLRSLSLLLLGAAIPVTTLVLFKLLLAPPSDFSMQSGDSMAEKLVDVGRWRLVLTSTWSLLKSWGHVPGGALFWSGLVVVLAARANRRAAVRAAAGTLVVAMMLGGYLAVYVISPYPLWWHIATSFERLLVQLWPAAVWSAFQLCTSARAPRAG